MDTTLCKILSLIWENDMNEVDFCIKLGINKSAVTDWKKGKTQSYKKHIPAISNFFSIPESYFSDNSELSLVNSTPTVYDSSAGTPPSAPLAIVPAPLSDEERWRQIGQAYDAAPPNTQAAINLMLNLDTYIKKASSEDEVWRGNLVARGGGTVRIGDEEDTLQEAFRNRAERLEREAREREKNGQP